MKKVLIADDDFLVRNYLKQMINWEQHGLKIIADAKNGLEAEELLKKISADILISDVSMPIMDGIELTRRVKKNFPNTHILILSCHDDFNHVKTAIKLGIDDYILKNDLTPETLLDALNKIQILNTDEDDEQSIIDQNKIRREFFKCFDENSDSAQLMKLIDEGEFKFKSTAALIIIPRDKNNREKNFFNAFSEMSFNVCKNILDEKVQTYLFNCADEKFIHWGLLIDDDEIDDEHLNKIIERLKNFSQRYFNLDLDCEKISAQKNIIELSYQWRQKINEMVEEKKYPASIRAAIKYIKEHYREDLSQTTVAEEIFLNASYFSTLFKKYLGIGFNEYLVDLRLNHMKHRLETTTEKIQDIAMTEGFSDYQYFCKVFKKSVGMNPSTYRQKFFH